MGAGREPGVTLGKVQVPSFMDSQGAMHLECYELRLVWNRETGQILKSKNSNWKLVNEYFFLKDYTWFIQYYVRGKKDLRDNLPLSCLL